MVDKVIEQLEKDLLEDKRLRRKELNEHRGLKVKNILFKNKKTDVYKRLGEKLDKYDPSFKLLPIKYRGKNVLRIRIKEENEKHYTRASIQKISNKISAYMKKKKINGMLSVAMRFPFGYRPGTFTQFGEPAHLFESDAYYDDYIEPDTFRDFEIYICQTPKAAGGSEPNDKFNDCLYNCLKLALNDDLPYNSGYTFKNFLKLKRTDKVPIELMPIIEKKLKGYGINIRGDYIYTTTVRTNKIIHLKLVNEHYSLDNEISNKKISNVSWVEKIPLLYDFTTREVYDGKTRRILGLEEKQLITRYKTQWILIEKGKDKVGEGKNKRDQTLEEAYESFVSDANTLKEKTNGIINLYKTGTNKRTALNLLDRFTKFILTPETIQQDETVWIKKANKGAIIFSEPYEGPGYKYDIKSMYPSIMNGMLLCPLKRGEFLNLDGFEGNYFKMGIYRCEIGKSTDPNSNKLFRFNPDNYYTHISLSHAQSLNLTITLIMDTQPNFLHYSRDSCITCHELFGKFIDFTFPLKDQGLPRMKKIINVLWGALSEVIYDAHNICINSTDEYEIPDDVQLFQLKPDIHDENKIIFKTTNYNHYYKNNFARMAPFLTSKGRFNISEIMKPYKENAKRCHTDGLIVSEEPVGIKTGSKLGDLVYEGYSKCCKIKNCNDVEGEFVV